MADLFVDSCRDDSLVGAARLAPQQRTIHAQQRRVLPGTRYAAEPQGSRPRHATDTQQTAGRSPVGRFTFPVSPKAQYNWLLTLFSFHQLNFATFPFQTACPACLGPAFFYGNSVVNGGVPVYAIVREYQDAWKTVDVVYHTFYPYNRGKLVCIGMQSIDQSLNKNEFLR